jgi:hypothetical protein
MRWSDIELEGSYPFDESQLAAEELVIWRSFPDDLRRVLARTNGGELTADAVFDTGCEFTRNGRVEGTGSNWLELLWAFLPRSVEPRADGPRSILREHFDRHLDEDFLPSGVYAFGECDQGCLVAVSTNAADHGAIYYWEWYWRYPWYEPFFDARIAAAKARWPERAHMDKSHPDWPRMRDDLNYATLVRLAPSFDAWVETWQRHE